MHTARFELRVDEDTGRRYWWGAEDGWKDPTEIGEDGVLTLDAQHFEVGTVLRLGEPTRKATDAYADQFVRGAHDFLAVFCGVDGCDEPATGDHACCKKHQMRFQRTGDPTLARKRGRKPKKEQTI